MKRATVTEAKNGLSALLDRVKAGESIVIVERGRPVAHLVPAATVDDDEGRLARLERAGVIKRGTGKIPEYIVKTKPPSAKPGGSILEALLEERRSGR